MTPLRWLPTTTLQETPKGGVGSPSGLLPRPTTTFQEKPKGGVGSPSGSLPRPITIFQEKPKGRVGSPSGFARGAGREWPSWSQSLSTPAPPSPEMSEEWTATPIGVLLRPPATLQEKPKGGVGSPSGSLPRPITIFQEKPKGGVGSPSGFARGAGREWPSPSWKVAHAPVRQDSPSKNTASVELSK